MLCIMMLMAMVARADVVATWDFQNNFAAGDVSLQSTTGTVASDVEGIELYVDATADNAKLQTRGSDAQFNIGTIIQVPVQSAKDTVTVTSYPSYHNYTVGGVEATEDVTVHKATSAEAAQGYVEVVGTGSSYLYSIQVVQVSMIQEKTLYSTIFTEWTDASSSTTESQVSWTTKYSHETLTFSLYRTAISSYNSNTSKFDWEGGWLMADKSADPYVITSPLSSITKVHYIHGATGSARGWAIYCKGDGDDDWVLLSDAVASNAKGTDVDVDVNRTNVQLKFTNINSSQNAYLMQLDIYGNVDMSLSPTLGTVTVNGTSYEAADIFSEADDGTQTATIEISKTQDMVSESNPVTAEADNGDIGDITYVASGDDVIVTIPVTANGETINYVATCTFKPDYTLTYLDTDGSTVLGTQTVEKDAAIEAFAYGESNVTVADGYAFRGWFEAAEGSGNRKYTVEDAVTSDLTLYGLATEIEVKSTTARYTFDLTDKYFYAEDHEAFVPEGSGVYHDGTHGWSFASGDVVKILVGGNAYILPTLCRYSNSSATITIKSSDGTELGSISGYSSTDGVATTYYYEGEADELQLVFSGSAYLHALTIINDAAGSLAKNSSGWYVVEAGNADNLLSTIDVANASASSDERTYIYVPAGTYDLGETVLTKISGDNISIIGDSIDKTIIVNAPKVENEGIGTTATFYITGENTYFQDLTLQNALDYYNSSSAGRAVVIQEKGNRTICKNVKMLSYQDTYYSNANGQYYFEDGEIHGTVDYLCGSGDVYYNRVRFVNESRSASGNTGSDVIAAPYPGSSEQWGYVMNECTIETNSASFSFGRSWGGESKLAYINTIILDASKLISTRFTTSGMNTPAYSFKEYNSVDSEGNVLTPDDNTQTFSKDNTSYTYNTTLTADEAAEYAIENVFTDWAPAELTVQAEISEAVSSEGTISWTAVDGTPGYAIFKDGDFVTITTSTSYTATEAGTYTIRAANSMGGFGEAVSAIVTEADGIVAVESTDSEANGGIAAYYSIDGTRLQQPQRGVNIRVMANGKADKVVVK